jgi:glycosyltransferase involved in cell wall biosynthesis
MKNPKRRSKLKKNAFDLAIRTARLGGRIMMPLFNRNQRAMNLLLKTNNWLTRAASVKPAAEVLRSIRAAEDIRGGFGLNVAGYITSESGVGEAVRANIRAIQKAGIPCALNNLKGPSRQSDDIFSDFSGDNPYGFNLIHVNANDVPLFLNEKGIDYFLNKYNIGFWYWELSDFPKEWHDCFKYYNEIWAASDFCRDTISKASPVPVVKVPPSVVAGKMKDVKRAHFGLKDDDFIFFFMFDFFSYFERKNPMAVLKAFKAAFKPGDGAQLVLKCSNSEWNPAARDMMLEEARGLNVKFMDGYLGREEINSLMALSDCYVSLHRSEGFGLPMAEAMYLGKPVIATDYSGNTEFMTRDNSFPVRYRLIELERDFGPYRKGNVWAEPDIDDAAKLMRLVYEDRALARRVGEKAASDIRQNLSPEATGRRILDRLRQIAAERRICITEKI